MQTAGRPVEEAKDLVTFLEWLREEKALMLAMMADAATETLELLRLTDYEGFPEFKFLNGNPYPRYGDLNPKPYIPILW